MAKVFPTQLRDFLDRAFPPGDDMNWNIAPSKMGAIAGFLELFDKIPEELVRLEPGLYAKLIESIGEIRFRSQQYMYDVKAQVLGSVGQHIAIVREIVECLPDSVPSVNHDLAFIEDQEVQKYVGLDLSAIATALQSGEWKGATILAGSCCEALLLYGLETAEKKSPGVIQSVLKLPKFKRLPSDLTEKSWDLSSYAEAAHHLKLITDNTAKEVEPAREYRNLIHPAKVKREQFPFDRGTAYVGTGAVEHVIRDLRRTL